MDARPLTDTQPSMPEDALAVPLTGQDTDYSCGAAALLAVLRYWGVGQDVEESDLYEDIDTTERDGTPPDAMAEEAEARGLKANYRGDVTTDDLKDALTAGLTVILDIQSGDDPSSDDDGHYVVLVGMDDANAYVMDPASGGSYAWVPLDELDERWHDDEDHGALFIEGTSALSSPLADVELERL
jgi:predicted double-glycine peptidase